MFKLRTEACDIVFSLRKSRQEIDLFDFDIECAMAEAFAGFYPKDFFCQLYGSDLKRLVQHFGEHCQGLRCGDITESPVYLPLEADFQVRCLDGDVEDPVGGYFSICFLFNCGKPSEGALNTYFGFETIVLLSDLDQFCSDVMALVVGLDGAAL